jgi:hypothetical protein
MPRNRREIGACPRCGTGVVTCSFNSYVNGAERIDSWEHRCRDCSFRETRADRAPAADAPAPGPRPCPFCGRASP